MPAKKPSDNLPKVKTKVAQNIQSPSLQAANLARQEKANERRQQVGRLLNMGYKPNQIATMLGVNYWTVRNDIDTIDRLVQLDAIPALATRIARSVAQREQVIQQAWQLFYRLSDDKQNKTAALALILQARDGIDKLEGTNAPEHLNAAATAELFNTLIEVAGRQGGQALVADLMNELAYKLRGSSASVVAGALEAPVVDMRKPHDAEEGAGAEDDPQYDADDTREDEEV